MAFSRRRRREEGAVEPEVVAGPRLEGRHFFKIILSDTLESGKLGIPKSFLRRCGKDLSNSVLLQVPASATWTIELEKRNNDMVSLWKGWREFMEYYSVGHGHLIVFEYKGNSTFCVIIFDKSASEIDYSLSSGETPYVGSKFTSPKTEDVVEAEDLTPRRRMRVEPYSPYSQLSPIYTPRRSRDGIRQSRGKVNCSEPIFGGPTRIGPLSGFASEYPFFEVMMQPSYLKQHVLYVPRGFIMLHIRKIKEIATLRHSGRSWQVKLRSYGRHGARFASGSFAFIREARLRLGNVCVFELIDGDDIVFRVYIFSGAGRNKQSKSTASLSEPVFHGPTHLTTPELEDEFDSVHPFFKLVIPGYQTRKMDVPVGFTRKHIQEHTDMVTLRYSDRSWPVKLLRYKQDHKTFFSGGWPAFARENCLCVGDVCMFELVDRDNFVFKVSIFRSAASIDTDPKEPKMSQALADSTDRIQQSACTVSPSELVFHGPTLPRPLTPPELANKFDVGHPFFKRVILRSCMFCLSLPCGFIKQNIQENKGMATLRFSGKLWPVKLLSYAETRRTKKIASYTHKTRVFFSAGWAAFSRENCLRVGDVCMFELIDCDNFVFRVSIFRSAVLELNGSRSPRYIACIDTDPEESDLSQAQADSTVRIQQSTCTVSHSELVFHGPTLPRPLTPPELAGKFDSKHPFFKMVITRSYLSCLSIPAGFIMQHIQENKGMATLRFSGKSWPVKLVRYNQTRKRLSRYTHHTRVFFCTGWLAFARETHIRVGNICTFELIDRDNVVFQVSIFSSAGWTEQSTCRASRSEPDFHGPEHPFFKLVMPPSYMTCLRVPVKFAKKHLHESKQMATLRYLDSSWPVKIARSPGWARGTVYLAFSTGWRAFARETHLRAGYVCVFELIDRDETVFKVSILSGADNDEIHVD